MEIHSTYERVFPLKSLARKVLIFGIYVLFAIAAILLILFTMNIYVAVLCVLAEITLILLTKKYLSVELEYSFVGGVFTVSKIYGKSYRRVALELDLKACVSVAFADADALARAESMCSAKPIDLSCPISDNDTCVAVWDTDKVRKGVIFTADARTLKILYRANAQSCSQEIRVKAR